MSLFSRVFPGRAVSFPAPSPKPSDDTLVPATTVLTKALQQQSGVERPWHQRFLERVFGEDSANLIGWMNERGSGDATADFERAYADVVAGKTPLPAEAREHDYLVVSGFLGENLPTYMEGNLQQFVKKGFAARAVPVDTEGSVAANARVVRDSVLQAAAQGKKAVLIAHSKGGVDVTAALSLYPELLPHVRAVVGIQVPYGGSPIAQDLVHCNELARLTRTVMTDVFDGDEQALRDLTYDERRAFIRAHPYPKQIPTVSLVSESVHPLSVTCLPSKYVHLRYGRATDGLVAPEDAVIPGSKVVRVEGLDHAGSAMADCLSPSGFSSGLLTEALVAVALSLPPPSATPPTRTARGP